MAFFARSLLPSAGASFTFIAGSYALAWLTALLTMIAPAGVGIREGVLGLLLGRVLAPGTGLDACRRDAPVAGRDGARLVGRRPLVSPRSARLTARGKNHAGGVARLGFEQASRRRGKIVLFHAQ